MATPKFDVTVSALEIDAALARTENPRHRTLLLNMREHLLLEASGRWKEVLSPRLMVEKPMFHLYTPNGRLLIEGMSAVENFYREFWESETSRSAAVALVRSSSPGRDISVTDTRVIGVSQLVCQRWGHELLSMSTGRAVATGTASRDNLDPDRLYLETFHMVYIFEYGDGDKLVGENTYSAGDSAIWELSNSQLVTPADAARAIKPFLDNPPPRFA
jgi:hypothetical protein